MTYTYQKKLFRQFESLSILLESGNDSYRFKASSETAKKKRKEAAALTAS